MSRGLIRVRDALWAIGRDRIGAARSVDGLLGGARSDSAVETMLSVHQVLAGIDRLEVRGRDSAGIHLMIRDPGEHLHSPAMAEALCRRGCDPAFGSGTARLVDGVLSIVHKTAAEIGELGDNTAVLRHAIATDELLAAALDCDHATATVLGHTRWASVGIISGPNAHPLDSTRTETPATVASAAHPHNAISPAPPHQAPTNSEAHHTQQQGTNRSLHLPYVVAAVNGDVDNYNELFRSEGVVPPDGVTTDSKTVPTLTSRRISEGHSPMQAFREAVAVCEGSVAVAAVATDAPTRMMLALRGSGQGLYVGLADDAFVVASEPYGVVEETSRYVRMDGETPGPDGVRGQIIEIDATHAGSIGGINKRTYADTAMDVTTADVVTAQITTRDIDRGDHPHFLLKEISEAPGSFRKTLRGRIVPAEATPAEAATADDPSAGSPQPGWRLVLAPEAVPEDVRHKLRTGEIRRVAVIGQGTAAVAGAGLVDALRTLLDRAGAEAGAGAGGGQVAGLEARSFVATEFSAFHLRPDMTDTLVVAISQSGTTTDTNRTTDLCRARGAAVIAVVNRRNSDLTERAHGVLYTSDGRDVEMSVASTKAFYSQVAAGWLLALMISAEVCEGAGVAIDHQDRSQLMEALLHMPGALEQVLAQRNAIADAARSLAPSRRHWAVVGSGANSVAAREIRIKLSELCYKSIPQDITEDKKHIDLSSEPLVVVCAAGLPAGIADDVAKEVAIFRAHRGEPVVVTDDTEGRFDAASVVLAVPQVDPRLVCVPVTMVGHLFGYEAALAIDAGAAPLRRARAALEASAGNPGETAEGVLTSTEAILRGAAGEFRAGLRNGSYNGGLEASTAVRIATALRYALGLSPLEAYELEVGRQGTPSVVLEDLLEALSLGIDELTRPVDAIRHQAKTVTVGISRSDETLAQSTLALAVAAAGVQRDRLSYATLRTLDSLSPAVQQVTGHTRYRIDGLEPTGEGQPSAVVITRSGIAESIPSRTEQSPLLVGTKHRVALEREVLAARGRHDGRSVIFVPEVTAATTVGITLLHVNFVSRMSAQAAAAVLQGYRSRYMQLRAAVTETESAFNESMLAGIEAVDLLTAPIGELSDRWRAH